MGLLTFKGGIHPDDGKRFSKDQPIKPLYRQVISSILSPSISVLRQFRWLKKGDRVLKVK